MHNAKTVKLISQWTEVGEILIYNHDSKGEFSLFVPDIIALLYLWASIFLPIPGHFPQMMLPGHEGHVGRVLETLLLMGEYWPWFPLPASGALHLLMLSPHGLQNGGIYLEDFLCSKCKMLTQRMEPKLTI